MSCGRDNFFLKELQLQNSILEDYQSIFRSKTELRCISIDIKENYIQIMMEEYKLYEKMHMYHIIGGMLMDFLVAEMKKEHRTPEQVNALDTKLSTLEELDEIYYSVKEDKKDFQEKHKQLLNPMKETEKKWFVEPMPDESVLREMASVERKNLVNLWKDREVAAEEGRVVFEDLKAEWDSIKLELDSDLMECLRGIASLKEF